MASVRPRFSVVVPTHNRASLLQDALDALLHQTLPAASYEVIVVDDASQDRTCAVLAGYTRQAARVRGLAVKWLHLATTAGPAAARNAGLEAAAGDIVAFTDDDCLPSRGWLERMATTWAGEATSATKPLGGVGGRTLALGPRPAPVALRYMRSRRWLEMPKSGLGGVEYLLTSNASYLRRALEEVGGFDPGFGTAGGEDADLGRRIVSAGYRLAYDPAATVHHQMEARSDVRALLATAYRYGRGEGHLRRKAGQRTLLASTALLGLSFLRLASTPLRAARHHRQAGLPWQEALPFALLDGLVAVSAAVGRAQPPSTPATKSMEAACRTTSDVG